MREAISSRHIKVLGAEKVKAALDSRALSISLSLYFSPSVYKGFSTRVADEK